MLSVPPDVLEETRRKNEIKQLEGQLSRLKYEQFCYENNIPPDPPPKKEYKPLIPDSLAAAVIIFLIWFFILRG